MKKRNSRKWAGEVVELTVVQRYRRLQARLEGSLSEVAELVSECIGKAQERDDIRLVFFHPGNMRLLRRHGVGVTSSKTVVQLVVAALEALVKKPGVRK
jgi:hypothetical protein